MSSAHDEGGTATTLRVLGADDDVIDAFSLTAVGCARCDRGGTRRARRSWAFPVAHRGGWDPHSTTGVSPVCVGDWCAATTTGEPDTYALLAVLPRRTALVRQSSGSRVESQALAANIDTVMVVVSLDRPVSGRQIERFLALAWDSGAQPVLVLTKADLVDDDTVAAALADVSAVSGDLSVLVVSVVTGAGMDEVAALVQRGLTVALARDVGLWQVHIGQRPDGLRGGADRRGP